MKLIDNSPATTETSTAIVADGTVTNSAIKLMGKTLGKK